MENFKVWCKNKNEWEKDNILLSESGLLFQINKGRVIQVRRDTHIIIPPTGVKDINKKESDLGDIVKK